MDQVIEISTVGILIGVVTLTLLFFGCCICLCCGLPALQIIGSCFLGSALTKVFCGKNRTVTRSDARYEMILNPASPYSSVENTIPVAIAEAHWVAPLAAARIVNNKPSVETPYSNHSTDAQENSDVSAPNFKDRWAAYLFLLNVVAVASLAIHTMLTDQSSMMAAANAAPDALDTASLLRVGTLLGSAVIFLTIASLFGTGFLYAVIHYPALIIESILVGSIFFWLAIGVLSFLATASFFALLIFGLFATMSAWYYFSVRNRIPFASAILATASRAIKQNYTGLILTSYGILALQLVWFALWFVAASGMYDHYFNSNGSANNAGQSRVHNNNNNNNNGQSNHIPYIVSFLMTLSLYWGVQLTKSVLQCTVAGTVGSWWFQPESPSPVRGSLLRATTTSFGSLCFGSLLVAIVRTVRKILSELNLTRRNGRDGGRREPLGAACVQCCLVNLLQWMESLLVYFNKYSFCYVAAYGLSFIESGKRVTDLFFKRGWTAIINDNLVSNVLSIGVVAMSAALACVGAGASFLMASGAATKSSLTPMMAVYVYAGIGAAVGAAVGVTVFGAVESGVAMVFVCLADDASSLLRYHPRDYSSLANAWAHFNSGVVDWRVDARCLEGGDDDGYLGAGASTVAPAFIVNVEAGNPCPGAGDGSRQSYYEQGAVYQHQQHQHQPQHQLYGYAHPEPARGPVTVVAMPSASAPPAAKYLQPSHIIYGK